MDREGGQIVPWHDRSAGGKNSWGIKFGAKMIVSVSPFIRLSGGRTMVLDNFKIKSNGNKNKKSTWCQAARGCYTK